MSSPFREIFDGSDDPSNERAKYLSRLFGIFSERVVSVWSRDPNSRYEDLGRPTLRKSEEQRGYTLDFTFRSRLSGKTYAAEMKCEIEYQNFKFFILSDVSQLDHHQKPAFHAFLEAARNPHRFSVNVKRKRVEIDGAILVWGAVNAQSKELIQSETRLHDILSIEEICRDLMNWKNDEYIEMIEKYRGWSNHLFDGLLSNR